MSAPLYETPAGSIYWYDDDETILILEIRARWTWAEAYEAVQEMNRIARSRSAPVYNVLHFTTVAARIVPKDTPLSLISRLMKDDVPNEALVFYVATPEFLKVLLRTVQRAYRLVGQMPKYRYVSTLDEVLQDIEHHRKNLSEALENSEKS